MNAPSHVNRPLIDRIEVLHRKALAGDTNAETKLRDIGARASEGDGAAQIALNTLAVIHHQHTSADEWHEVGEAFKRLKQNDPEAIAWIDTIGAQAHAGDPGSRRIVSMLHAHKGKEEASAWAIPHAEDLQGNTRVRNLPNLITGALPFPHFSAEGTRERRSTHAHAHQKKDHAMPHSSRYPEVGALTPASSQLAQHASRFLQVTPAVEAQLVTMMLRSAAGASGASTAAAAQAAVASAPSAPVGPFEAPICARARDAIARNSPVAPALVAQCNAASGRQVLAPMAATVTPLGAEGTVAPLGLGRIQSKPAVHLGRIGTYKPSAADLAPQGICNRAADAKGRNSPVYPQLATACATARRNNIMQGLFFADAMTPNDPAYRVALTDRGEAIIARNPKMAEFRATIPAGDQQRGFTMAMGIRDASSKVDERFLAFVRPGLAVSTELLKGFDNAMAM
jgi:hypothetical protein